MDNKAYLRLESLITKAIENKYFDHFEKMADYAGNGIYTIDGLYSTDTRELLLMYCAKQEGFDYESESPKPEMLSDSEIDLSTLKKTLQSIMDDMWGDDYHEDNDDSQYVYESAMEAFFGEGIWDKINKQLP